MFTHTRTRWTSAKGVEFVDRNYTKYGASLGYTDIRYAYINLNEYEMDLLIDAGKTVPQISKGYDLAINGPFVFNGKPIGFVVKNGKMVQETVSAVKWADFILRDIPSIGQLDPSNIRDIKLSFSSTPQIVKDGKIHINLTLEGTPKDVFANARPRTALGITKDNRLVICVVDGDSKWDAGLKIDQLAAVMIKLGVVQAINLDGGGSSVMVYQDKAVSGNKGTRGVGAAVVFKKRVSSKPPNTTQSKPKMMDVRNTLKKHPTRVYANRPISDIKNIVIHHSLTKTGSAESYAEYHVGTNGWPGIGYAYVVEQDGTIKICHDLAKVTYHVGNSNRWSLGICLTGDFRSQQPTKEQYNSLMWLVNVLKDTIPQEVGIKGHSEMPGYSWKECPVISMDKVRADILAYR